MLDRFTADRHDALQELDHRAAENVVAVSCNHVARVRYVDVLAVRTQRQKILRARFRQDIGEATPNEQRGQGEPPCTGLEPLLSLAKVESVRTKARIPVPAEFAISTEPNVLSESIKLFGTLAVRLVPADRFSNLLERIKAFWLLSHKILDFGDAFCLDSGCDIDKHESGCIHMILPRRDETGTATH